LIWGWEKKREGELEEGIYEQGMCKEVD